MYELLWFVYAVMCSACMEFMWEKYTKPEDRAKHFYTVTYIIFNPNGGFGWPIWWHCFLTFVFVFPVYFVIGCSHFTEIKTIHEKGTDSPK